MSNMLSTRDYPMNPQECIPPKLRDQLAQRIERAEQDLATAKLALSLLDKNPDFEQLQDAVAKLRML